jgi:hypothetical protein
MSDMSDMTKLRLMIEDLNGDIGFTMVPTLQDGSGWILGAFTDCVNVVEVRYYNAPKIGDVNFVVTSEAQRAEWAMSNATLEDVAHKVVGLLTTRTLG